MDARNRLYAWKDPYDLPGTDALFLRAMRENLEFQWEHCPEYRKILTGLGFSPEMLKTGEDLKKLPFFPTLFFKSHTLFSMPEHRMLIKATSSGTSGSMSHMGFDAHSLWHGLRMVLRLGKYHRLFSWKPANYIVLGYKPHRGNQTAVTKTAFGATCFTPALRREYALKYWDGGYQVDLEGVAEALERFERSAFPTRFMGFPSYTWFLLSFLKERGKKLRLKPGSRIMLGGGWKQFYREKVEKEELYALAQEVLGLGEESFVEFFGAAEHPILYCTCRNHRFHVPVYSRVVIRDPETFSLLPMGRMGLVELMTPMVHSVPILSVMTDDLGILRDGRECGCGISSPTLEIVGRVGMQGIKTCAASAEDVLKEAGV